MLVYKLLRTPEWVEFERAGETAGAPADLADGFVHFSTAGQLPGTLVKHFAGESRLMLLAIDAESLGADLRWEAARGGALFPHLYRSLRRADVVRARALEDAANGPVLPDRLS